jgi:hypothetical protein
LDLLEVLGDEYISQHVLQAYRDYLEQTSYKVYMSNMARGIASALTGSDIETSWIDILHDLDNSVRPEKQTETEEEVKSRILARLNRKEDAQIEYI